MIANYIRPLTVVHVSNFPFGLRPGFQHGVPVKITNGLVRNGHLVLNYSDRDIARAKSIFGSRKLGRRPTNAALRVFCQHHRPDLVLFGHADMIDTETLHQIRQDVPGVRLAQWNVDPLFSPDNVARLKRKMDAVDATFVSTAGEPLRALGDGRHKVAFLPNPMDGSIEHGENHLVAEHPYDVFYACGHPSRPLRTICGREWDMEVFFTEVLSSQPELRPLLGGLLGRPHLTGAGYQIALQSVAAGLNISRRPDHHLYSSDRLAQMAGNGLAILMERTTGYDTLFGEDEFAFFSSLDELIEKMEMLRADHRKRMKIAAAGRAKYQALFDGSIITKYMTDVIFEERAPSISTWDCVSA